jgi:hypothetical protein
MNSLVKKKDADGYFVQNSNLHLGAVLSSD